MHGWHVVVIQLSSNFLEHSHKYLVVYMILVRQLSVYPTIPGASREGHVIQGRSILDPGWLQGC